MALTFGSKDRAEATKTKLILSKADAQLLLNILAEGEIKIKNIQPVYDLIYRITEYTQQND